jgi:hypothetical protein
VILTQIEMHLSLISATIPVLRPVIMNLSTSYSSLGPKESSKGYANSAGTYKLSTLKPSAYSDGKASRNSPRTDSVESHNSEQMIIRKQISWRVERGEVGRPQ